MLTICLSRFQQHHLSLDVFLNNFFELKLWDSNIFQQSMNLTLNLKGKKSIKDNENTKNDVREKE
jgi:hypothetical protein